MSPSVAVALSSPFALGWLVTAGTVAIALRQPGRPYPPLPATRHPVRAPLIVALGVIVTRIVLRPRFVGDWFLGDEHIDACVASLQLLLGEPIWGGFTNYLSYAAYLAGYRVFGFGPRVARLTIILAVAAAAALSHVAVRRATDARSAWIASFVIIVAGPYVAQSLFATAIGLALVPAAVALLLVVGPITVPRAVALGPLAAAGLFVYPPGAIAVVALGAVHALVFRERWSLTTRLAAVTGCAGGAILALLGRWLVTGQVRARQWSHGGLDFSSVLASLGVVARDVIWESRSFDAVNLEGPYLDSALLGFVIAGIAAGWRERDARWRWACVGVLAFVVSMIIASTGGALPGIRRAFAPQLFLGFAIARGVIEFRRRAPRWLAVVVPLFAAGLVAWHTARLVASWPQYPEPDFIRGAREVLAAERMAGHDVIVIGEPTDGLGGHGLRCMIGLEDRLSAQLGRIRAVRRADLATWRDAPAGPVVILASQPIAEHELTAAFGRAPTETIPRPALGVDHLALRVVYVLPPASPAAARLPTGRP